MLWFGFAWNRKDIEERQTHLRRLKWSKEEDFHFPLTKICNWSCFIEKSEASKEGSPQPKSDLQTKGWTFNLKNANCHLSFFVLFQTEIVVKSVWFQKTFLLSVKLCFFCLFFFLTSADCDHGLIVTIFSTITKAKKKNQVKGASNN